MLNQADSQPQNVNGKTPNSQEKDNVNGKTPNSPGPQPLTTSNVSEPFSWKDIHSLRFIVQIIFSGVILIFCLTQLASANDSHNNDHKDNAIYWGGVTGILALWMPSPSSTCSSTKSQANIGEVNNSSINN
jgi:hypothetical protein